MKSIIYWVESKDSNGKVTKICHSKDDKTGELYYKYLSRAAANKLLKDEKSVSGKYKYRVVTEVRQKTTTEWE